MTAEELINEYKTLPKNCYEVDYGNPSAIKLNNDSVKRMYKIVQQLNKEFGVKGIEKINPLLDVTNYRTNLWLATHLLEKAKPDQETEKKALAIIERFANGDDLLAAGYKSWLKAWKAKKMMKK
jgi:hypothetical protein